MFPIRTILHPTDFSEHSRAAAQLACALARDYDARLVVLHVLPPSVVYGEGMVYVPPETYQEEARPQLERVAAGDPNLRVERRMIDGAAATEILEVAREVACDLIVLGTHGRTGLRRLLMGSVAEQVVRKAPCPVMTVKTPADPVSAEESARSEEPAPAR
jgi:nucleotide-binding universal stress UspA family protein